MNMKMLSMNMLALALSLSLSVSASAQAPLTLDQKTCRKMALESSEDIRKAENEMFKSRLDGKMATSAFLPSVDASGTGIYVTPNQGMSGMDLIMKGTYMAGIKLTQPLYAGGRIVTGKKMSKIGEEAAGQKMRMTRAEVISEADNAYWSYVSVQARQAETNLRDSRALISCAKDALAQSEENLRVVSNRYSASMCPLSDYLTARFQWHQSKSNLVEAVTQYHISLTDYLRSTGRL